MLSFALKKKSSQDKINASPGEPISGIRVSIIVKAQKVNEDRYSRF